MHHRVWIPFPEALGIPLDRDDLTRDPKNVIFLGRFIVYVDKVSKL